MLVPYFEPEIVSNVHLCSDLANDLAAAGYEVRVVAPLPVRGVDRETCQSYKWKWISEDRSGIKIHRVWVPFARESNDVKRLLYNLCKTMALFLRGLFIGRVDRIYVYASPTWLGMVGVVLGILKRAPVVCHLQDFSSNVLLNTAHGPKRFFVGISRCFEGFALTRCARIVTISRDFVSVLKTKGINTEKVDLVYNWIDEKKVIPVAKTDNSLYDEYGLDRNDFILTHCGNIGLTQNLELLADVARDLRTVKDLKFVVLGDGGNAEKLKDNHRRTGTDNLIFIPFQSYDRIAEVYSLGDVGIVIAKRNSGRNSFPSKTWSIMAAEKPVLASFDEQSELCAIINEARCGLCVPPESFDALRSAILDLYRQRDEARRMGFEGRNYIEENLPRRGATQKMIEILDRADTLNGG